MIDMGDVGFRSLKAAILSVVAVLLLLLQSSNIADQYSRVVVMAWTTTPPPPQQRQGIRFSCSRRSIGRLALRENADDDECRDGPAAQASMMKIERATQEDIPHLNRLLTLLFDQAHEFEPNIEAQTRALTTIIDDHSVGDILVARRREGDGPPVVAAMANVLYSVSTALGGKVAHLDDLVVDPDYRGQGLGNRMMEHAVDHARSTGCLRITLNTDQDNHRAQSLYEKHAFVRSTMLVYTRRLDYFLYTVHT